MSAAVSKLFQPIKVGSIGTLSHRVALAPLTRYRASATHVVGDLVVEYYKQRASTPGTLLITEATFISQKASGDAHAPGIYNEEQVAAWKRVTDVVHAKGSFIVCQLWALGRAAKPEQLLLENPEFPYVSASDVPLSDRKVAPRPLTVEEIKEYVQDYATAAANAIRAGFDGIEIHGANGYLVDQFLQDVSNKRTDQYGGSIENRARFGLEVVDAIVKAIGPGKTAIRLSPWGTYQDMRMKDPKPTFSYFVQRLKEAHPDLAYVHVIDSRDWATGALKPGESNDFLREIWAPKVFVSNSGYTPAIALESAEERDDIIAFGRGFLANPDLPIRIRKNIPLTDADPTTFYSWEEPKGYIDYPFADAQA